MKMFEEIQITEWSILRDWFLAQHSQKKDFLATRKRVHVHLKIICFLSSLNSGILCRSITFYRIAVPSWVTSTQSKYKTIDKTQPVFVMCSSSSATMAWSPRGMLLKSLYSFERSGRVAVQNIILLGFLMEQWLYYWQLISGKVLFHENCVTIVWPTSSEHFEFGSH